MYLKFCFIRIKSDVIDFLLEDVDLQESICDVFSGALNLVLEEKNFKVELNGIHGISYTDRRAFELSLQLISNAAKMHRKS